MESSFNKLETTFTQNDNEMAKDGSGLMGEPKKLRRGNTANFDSKLRKTLPHELPASELLKPKFKSTEDMKQLMEVQGSHRTLFYRPSRKHVSAYSTIFVNLEGTEKKVSFENEEEEKQKKEKQSMVITLPIKSEKLVTKGTQTDYRESEAQTLPWSHEIKAEGKILTEILTLDWFNSDKNYPPGIEEVTLIENARQKLAWENIIERLKGKENELKRKSLTIRLANSEAAFKESKKEEEGRERIEMSRQKMKEVMKAFEEKLWLRLQKSYGSRRKENDSKIDYWNHQLTRKIRKIKSTKCPLVTKSGIIEMHKDKGSDLWAPKLRHGENPLLRHEVIDVQCRYLKRFHGLEILEKHITDSLYPDVFKLSLDSVVSKPEKPGLCPRKFRERVIESPKDEEVKSLSLKIPVPPPTPEPSIPRVPILRSDSEENLYQASLMLGKIIKGRSIQTQKFISLYKLSQ